MSLGSLRADAPERQGLISWDTSARHTRHHHSVGDGQIRLGEQDPWHDVHSTGGIPLLRIPCATPLGVTDA